MTSQDADIVDVGQDFVLWSETVYRYFLAVYFEWQIIQSRLFC